MRLSLLLLILTSGPLFGQINITIDVAGESHAYSKYLYGKNNSLSDDPAKPLSTAEWLRIKDSGVKFLRESGGNNCTKYNWRLKISSHPDWYNNVYAHDWDFAAKSLQQNLPSAQGMWSFQLLGKAAKTNTANFNDWGYNNSQWWSGVAQNLAGGGTVNPAGGADALVEGNPDLYLENWTADSTVKILDQWFNKLTLNKSTLQYWNMDNEVEIWSGTHDDLMPTQLPAEEFMQRYFEVAKKAREQFPEIKLVGPVTANEWQWYNWADGITVSGKFYPWLEYFIKRVAEEQNASGVKLLDVLDIHFYPTTNNAEQLVQYHRVYFDENYVFPEANGVKRINGTWDNTQTKEYILKRCNAWLEQYMGADHGVTFGVTETGVNNINASTTAVWYASTIGEFMRHPEMEIFAPWTWQPGMWEVLHLFARYNKTEYLSSTSSQEELVSAYPTLNEAGDSLTVVLVNRAVSGSKPVNLSFNGFDLADESFTVLKLAGLPSSETFYSHTTNALQRSTISQTSNAIAITLPAMSVTTLLLKGAEGEVVTGLEESEQERLVKVYPNPLTSPHHMTVEINKSGNTTLDLIDVNGRILYHEENRDAFKKEIDLSGFSKGVFILKMNIEGKLVHRKVVTY